MSMGIDVPAESVARSLALAVPGVEILAALEGLDPAAVAGWSADDRLYLVQAWERAGAWVAARGAAALAGFVGPVPITEAQVETDRVVSEDVRLALRLSITGTVQRIAEARALRFMLPGTAALLAEGHVTARHVGRIVEQITDAELTGEQAAQVEARVLPRASDQSVAEFTRSLTRAVAAVDTCTYAAKHARAAGRRRVVHYPEPDGMATFSALLTAVDAVTVWTAVDTVARTLPTHTPATTDPVTGRRIPGTRIGIDARRADALVQIACATLANPAIPRAHGRPITLGVLIDLPTLLGLADHPAELTGYGPIPADVARALAADVPWRRWVTDPVTGYLLDYGSTTYAPPQGLRDYLLAAHPRCTSPYCGQPSYRCELDHSKPYDQGGPTSAAGMRPQCKNHHHLKTLGHTATQAHVDGSTTTTTPTGRQVHQPPHNHQPETTPRQRCGDADEVPALQELLGPDDVLDEPWPDDP